MAMLMAKRYQAAESEGTAGGATRQALMTRSKKAAKATDKPATKQTSAHTDKSANAAKTTPATGNAKQKRKKGEGASEDEATTLDEDTTPLVPNHALRSTCLALQKKIADEKGEHRQGPRRKAGDYYKMADYQKRVWAEKYTAARNSDNDLD
ncbi:hypothetical protein PR003_g30908 [Phytophthora rubi]|uniref:Uncharacterized protein n=2 Tax=Phytophthora rubi TaxID=129364 RepID=A0A6A4B7G9_9STRA|nr:hypothetical protein PR003_g30908 [Phytophthora rubi]